MYSDLTIRGCEIDFPQIRARVVSDSRGIVRVLVVVWYRTGTFVGCHKDGGASADLQISAQLQFRDEFDAFVHRIRAVTFVGRSSNLRLAVLFHTLRDAVLLLEPERPSRRDRHRQLDPSVLDLVADLLGDVLGVLVGAGPVCRNHRRKRASRQVSVAVTYPVARLDVAVAKGVRDRVDKVGVKLPFRRWQSSQRNDRLGGVFQVVGDIPDRARVLGVRIRLVIELNVVRARCLRVVDFRLCATWRRRTTNGTR